MLAEQFSIMNSFKVPKRVFLELGEKAKIDEKFHEFLNKSQQAYISILFLTFILNEQWIKALKAGYYLLDLVN